MESCLKAIRKKLKTDQTVYIRIKVITNAPKNEWAAVMEDKEKTLKLRIKAKPENQKANREILKFLSQSFDCQAQIVSGLTHSVKLIKLNQE